MRLLSLLFIVIILSVKCFANQDTTYAYFNANRNPTQKADAVYVSKTTKESSGWHKQVFVIGNGNLYLDGLYADEQTHVPNGVIKHFGENKNIVDSFLFINGNLKAKYSFYDNGRMKNFIVFADNNHISGQGGFDESGKTISNYIVWQPATYPKSVEGWQKYLKRKLKQKLPGGYQKGMMNGKVIIQFTIDTMGNVTNANIVQKSGFIDLDQRALNVIEQSPKWMPAIKDNEVVESLKKQPFVFANNEANISNMDSFDVGYNIGYMLGSFLRY